MYQPWNNRVGVAYLSLELAYRHSRSPSINEFSKYLDIYLTIVVPYFIPCFSTFERTACQV